MNKYDRQIKQMVQMRFDNTDLPIYPDIIAEWLNCPIEVVENALLKLDEEGILQQVYTMRCAECNEMIAVSKRPFESRGYAECPACNSQVESASMNPVVNAYIRRGLDNVC